MSEFDKEEEREKLREKFAEDEARQETTEQMSELLLKGATMLNVHCDRCASPIFEYEGDEFCPTCGRSVAEIQASSDPEPSAADAASIDPQSEPAEAESPSPAPGPSDVERSQATVPETNAGEALTAAISRLADRAATAEDPRQATELLEAARTAAETLALVEGDGQSGS